MLGDRREDDLCPRSPPNRPPTAFGRSGVPRKSTPALQSRGTATAPHPAKPSRFATTFLHRLLRFPTSERRSNVPSTRVPTSGTGPQRLAHVCHRQEHRTQPPDALTIGRDGSPVLQPSATGRHLRAVPGMEGAAILAAARSAVPRADSTVHPVPTALSCPDHLTDATNLLLQRTAQALVAQGRWCNYGSLKHGTLHASTVRSLDQMLANSPWEHM